MKDSAKISIVMPAYNTEKYVGKCLKSIIKQSYKNWECIIVDDCSTDGTKDILQKFAQSDNRIKVYENRTNEGCGLTRRAAISLATGDWFAFVDSDDYIEEYFLAKMLNACKSSGAEISICGTKNRDSGYNYLGQDVAEEFYCAKKERLYNEYMLSSWIKQYNGNKLYARRVIDAVEYSPLRYCEDSATTYKWLWEANFAVVLPQSLYNYIHHSDSNSNKGNEPLQKALDTVACVYEHYLFCKSHNFTHMYDRLRKFIQPHLLFLIESLDIEDIRYKFADDIRSQMM